MKKRKHQGKAQGVEPEETQEGRDLIAYQIWLEHVVDCLSYPAIAAKHGKSVTWAYNTVQQGYAVSQKWRSTEKIEADLAVAIEQCQYIYRTSKALFDKGNAKHGALMCKARGMLNRIQGLDKFEVKHTGSVLPAEVLDRVKKAKEIISPLVAAVLPTVSAEEPTPDPS